MCTETKRARVRGIVSKTGGILRYPLTTKLLILLLVSAVGHSLALLTPAPGLLLLFLQWLGEEEEEEASFVSRTYPLSPLSLLWSPLLIAISKFKGEYGRSTRVFSLLFSPRKIAVLFTIHSHAMTIQRPLQNPIAVTAHDV